MFRIQYKIMLRQSKNHEQIMNKSSKNHQKIIKKSSINHQKIINKSSINHEEIMFRSLQLPALMNILERNSIIIFLSQQSMVWKKWWGGEKNDDSQASQHPAQTQTKSFYRSYSSSRTCKPDSEDPGYMICKEKVQDGNNVYENQQRVPISESKPLAFAVDGVRDFSEISTQFDKEFSSLPFFGSIFTPLFKDFAQFSFPHPETYLSRQHHHNHGQNGQYQHQQQQGSSQRQQPNSRYYFTGNEERDFSIKDL